MTPRNAALLVLGVLAVSISAPVIRLADAPPLTVAFYRNLFAAAVLVPVVALRHRREVRGLGRGDAGALALAGSLLALHFAAWIPSVTLTTVAASTVLVTTQSVWAAAGSRLLFGERIRGMAVAGIAVALAGSVVISGADFAISGRAFAGDLLALAGAVTGAGYLLVGSRLRRRLSLPTYAGIVYAACAALLLPAILLTGIPLAGFEPKVWLMFGLLALGPQILGHTVFNYLLREVDPTVVAVAIMGEPVGASLLAVLLFGEIPQAAAILGGALILGGIYVAVTAQARRPVAAPVE
jgi:drug/metabolite transporter (DMT)-like permease